MMRHLFTRPLFNFCSKNSTRCMILHPVSYPNKGPVIEQYLAQQAVGLAKSLGWTIVKGPFWNNNHVVPLSSSTKSNLLYVQGDTSELQDGDYIKTSIGNGTLYKDGIMFNEDESESEGDLYKQWRDKIMRESLANSSLIKAKRVTKKTYFTKGKLQFIAQYIQRNQLECLYINAELKPTQVKNLKKILEARINNISPAAAFKGFNQSESETQFETEDQSQLKVRRENNTFRKLKIFDRFSIILQIFAQRCTIQAYLATSKLSKLQIELSFLNYLRTRLVREGATYSSNLNIFYGDLIQAQQVAMEVISAKQRRAIRTLGGEGQSQLELERRQLRDKQAKIRREIQEETRLRRIKQDKTKKRGSSIPVVALVGYTNVGKSAFMNYLMKKQEVKSRDMLFETLATTSRNVILPSGIKITLLDTIGFITNLPVQMIEAFKSTLQQIAHADLVLHIRDVSHPQNQLQKQSVIKILKQLQFEPDFYTNKMLQVWNKIDLAPDTDLPQDLPQISCQTGEGMTSLIGIIEKKLQILAGKQKFFVEYGIESHEAVLNWLKANTNHTFNVEAQYNYEPTKNYPSGSVKVTLDLDEGSINKLNKFLNPEKPKDKKKKGMPPKEGW